MRAKKVRMAEKECFVISPMGPRRSRTREHWNFVLDKIIRPGLKRLNYKASRFDHLGVSGSITEEMIDQIRLCPLCIAIVTGFNANVMYEVGVRHAWDLPIILMVGEREIDKLPFDLKDCDTMPYSRRTSLIPQAIDELCKRIERIHVLIRNANPRAPVKMQGVFHDAMRKLAQAHALEPLFRTKEWILSTLTDRLNEIIDELRRDMPEAGQSPKSLARLCKPIKQVFGDVAARVRSLEKTIEYCSYDGRSKRHCKSVIQRMKGMQSAGVGMLRKWKDAKGTPDQYKDAVSMLESLVDEAAGFLPRLP